MILATRPGLCRCTKALVCVLIEGASGFACSDCDVMLGACIEVAHGPEYEGPIYLAEERAPVVPGPLASMGPLEARAFRDRFNAMSGPLLPWFDGRAEPS